MKPKDIRKLRKSKEWSQRDMAEYLGVEQPTVCRLESGKNEPSKPVVKLLELLRQDIGSAA